MNRGEEAGQVTVLIVGFALILLMAVGVVVDTSAAYLNRQSLDTLADGAALAGATIEGEQGYDQGLGQDRVELDERTARQAVGDYLNQVGAYADFKSLAWDVAVEGDTVVVTLSAAMELPIMVEGVTDSRVSSTGTSSLVLGG
ncbi:Flp pilus assembly protein TadG [Nocardioides daedukensis]|uniref:Flp pilus assembly protein TadG n=1 Tax=Nocardioides daedukensis TaxID=634462 RepID=A0A7Y9S290_9ACTN|nr:pilus assembly protein TadG-related protein [Nocardioides daedukensis]NYG58404.1 Flp pilus assembly protein TadG [Nocardioides daedukensis]